MKTQSITINNYLIRAIAPVAFLFLFGPTDLCYAACPQEPGCLVPKLRVPDDFPGNFSMALLGGSATMDVLAGATYGGDTNYWGGGFDVGAETRTIDFQASAFDGNGSGFGTSTLAFQEVDYWELGVSNTNFWQLGFPVLYVMGAGSGSLTDNGDGSGEWSLVLPTYMLWNNQNIFLGNVNYTTSATYTYMGASGMESISGSSLDYHTGDAFLVAQAVITDDPWLGSGVRLTIGLLGNDPPVTSSVPVPSAAWLLGSGLFGLIGVAKRKRIAS